MGEDILLEPEGNIRVENSANEVMIGVLALIGAPVENGVIRIGTDVKVINRWHSDVKLIGLNYTLNDGENIVVRGEISKGSSAPIVISSNGQKTVPLEFRIDPKKLDPKLMLGLVQAKRKLLLKGNAVIEVWGIEREYPFEKEVSKVVQKALKGGV